MKTNAFAPIVSPQAPGDLYALPYADRKVARCLPLNKTQRESLMAEGVITMADMDRWISRGGKFIDLAGVGPKTAEKIQTAYDSLAETKKWAK